MLVDFRGVRFINSRGVEADTGCGGTLGHSSGNFQGFARESRSVGRGLGQPEGVSLPVLESLGRRS